MTARSRRTERWLGGVTAVTLVALLSSAAGASEPGLPVPAAWPDPGVRLAAVPEPPEAPRPPLPVVWADDLGESPAPLTGSAPQALAGPPTLQEPPEAVVEVPLSAALAPAPANPPYPVVVTPLVEALVDQFVAKNRDRFSLWITRSGRYLPMIRQVFRERGLPEELAYTAMIESGFSPRAVSRVGAKGMWQFMEATGRRYGLVVNRWVDERLDPVKSTVAAAQYLGDLFGLFGHWFLAQAGYNAGEARVLRAITRARTSDFWALTQTRHLPDETKMFVPQILAAMLITREPGRYGFDVALEEPLAYEEVEVRRALDLDTVARLAGISVDEVRELNPALLARITPPFGTYALRLPPGAATRFSAALDAVPPASLPGWRVHRVGRTQSLADIARLYRVTPQRLAELNHLPGGRLRGVTELIVPAAPPPTGPPPGVMLASAPAAPARTVAPPREIVVRPGDTLFALATRHGTRPQTLAQLNGMALGDPLRAGARLKLPTP